MLKNIILSAAVALTCASSLAFAASPAMTGKTDKGAVLTDHKGMTLYTFSKDSVVTRDDGSKQWAYNGMPLYTWTKDSKARDTTGDGFKDMWKVAKP